MLKYLDNYYMEQNESVLQKMLKMNEEILEAIEEFEKYIDGVHTSSDIAQELLDVILTAQNLIKKMQDEELIDIGTETFKHSVKLNNYLEMGKYSND